LKKPPRKTFTVLGQLLVFFLKLSDKKRETIFKFAIHAYSLRELFAFIPYKETRN
jgi:hypothetical protein